MRFLILTAVFAVQLSFADVTCRFALKYNTSDLLGNASLRQQFLIEHATQEAVFCKTVGLDPATAMAYDGQRLDVDTGLPLGGPHPFSAPSKESLHVAVLARAVEGTDPIATAMYSPTEAVEILRKKVNSYELFHARFPGFGGFFPWVSLDGTGNVTPTWDWQNRVPALDNGELFWAAFACAHILEDKFPTEVELVRSWHQVWQNMTETAVAVFYAGNGNIRTVTNIENQYWPVSNNTYTGTGSSQPYLDDPYEGELFTVMVYLFCNLSSSENDLLWVNKRHMLQKTELTVNVGNSTREIAVQRGFWFSAHEQWKYLMLPYQRVPSNWRVFLNGERARSWYGATVLKSPGLWASVNGPVPSNDASFPYFSDCGIQSISFNNVTHDDVVTPYGAFPLFLASEPHAVGWLHHMILARKGQNCFGTTESMNITGTDVAPLVTWDSKITTVVAALKGVVSINEEVLSRMGKLDSFLSIIDREWSRTFGNTSTPLPGTQLPFLGPVESSVIPQILDDFSTCSATSPACEYR